MAGQRSGGYHPAYRATNRDGDMAETKLRQILLLAGGLIVIGGAVAVRTHFMASEEPPAPRSTTHVASPFQTFIAQAIETSKIVDPLERCLRMPNPPGSHWHREGVEAYCRYRNAPTLTGPRFRQLVAEGKAAEVDRLLSEFARAQAEDPAQPERLDGALDNMELTYFAPETKRAVDAWRKQRPHSAFAITADALQAEAVAWKLRGNDFAIDTPASAWLAVNNQAAIARAQLERAATLEPVAPTVFSAMFTLGTLTSDTAYANQGIERGLRLAPESMSLRLTQTYFSGYKWGGGQAVLLRQANEAAALAARQPLLWLVVGRAHIMLGTDVSPPGHGPTDADEVSTADDLGRLAVRAYRQGKFTQALILALEGWRFDDSEPNSLYALGMAAPPVNQGNWARETLKNAAHKYPESVELARNVGSALAHTENPEDAVEAERLLTYARDHDPSNIWTLSELGALYANELHRYDKAIAVSQALIRIDSDNPFGYSMRAYAQIQSNAADRYASIHVFLDRFGQREGQEAVASTLRGYLASHPEPSPH